MMEKQITELKVPIGFRFRPTDEELVVHYLKRRALSLPLPASVIPIRDVFHSDPWSLPGDFREKKYYFWKRKGEAGSKCSKIMGTSSGFWKAVGKGKQIISTGSNNDVVGCRKSWAFYQFNDNHSLGHWSKTRWFMHEFQLLHSTQNQTAGEMQDWVVCRIFQRKMRHRKRGSNNPLRCRNINKEEFNFEVIESPNIIDYKLENNFDFGPPQPSSPSLTIDDSDIHVETTSSCY